ncbi:TetR/AcrR family transcriptional regulator [Cohnella suwonensis]|uniref:TetR/AcrR family transcriptional regulator n=1 Tax=Cohnella suwonensis TaxID=696072 RepID=A0ABW0M283_9BACL
MKQQERRQQSFQSLLEATKELIREKSCQAITMQDIMERSGMSKGAIFHYVGSKDEIFALVLQERLEETNARFNAAVDPSNSRFDGPMLRLAERFASFGNPEDVTNKVLSYLLGKEDQPIVAAALKRYYESSYHYSKEWITTGQRHGVIPSSVNAEEVADMFMILSLGLRVRASIPGVSGAFDAERFTALVADILQAR